jgi:hypothetical protein
MSRVFTTIFPAMLIGLCLAANSSATAQQYNRDRGSWDGERDQSWYQQPTTYQSDTRAIIQHKAQVRAAQRSARLASLSWYGMSNSRPTAAPTPFMTLYSPVWQVPGGRPFAWFASNQPTTYVIYNR